MVLRQQWVRYGVDTLSPVSDGLLRRCINYIAQNRYRELLSHRRGHPLASGEKLGSR